MWIMWIKWCITCIWAFTYVEKSKSSIQIKIFGLHNILSVNIIHIKKLSESFITKTLTVFINLIYYLKISGIALSLYVVIRFAPLSVIR